jgi:large subunit ribosomal protein L4
MKIPVVNAKGKEVRKLDVDDTVFGLEPNGPVLHQAFNAQRANQRWGTAQTKNRSEVQGSTRKIRAQKYTGRARQGSNRSPTRVGGGVAFGPRMRDYSQALPKKMRRLAIRSALSGKVADGQLRVIDSFGLKQPKTKEMVRILRNVGIERSALIVTSESDHTVKASTGNLRKTKVLPAAYLNVVDVLNHRDLLMTVEAVRVAEGLWGQKVEAPPEEPKKRRPAKSKAAEAAAPVAAEKAPPRPKRKPAAAKAEPAKAEEPSAVEKPKRSSRSKTPEAVTEEKPKRTSQSKAPKAKDEAKPKRSPRKAAKPASDDASKKPKARRRTSKTKTDKEEA